MTKISRALQAGQVLRVFPLDDQLKSEFEKFFGLVAQAKRILISSTLTSDGDSIGAQLGLFFLIRELRKDDLPEIVIVNESPVPERYSFLPETGQIMTLEQFEKSGVSRDFDLGVTLDGGVERTGVVAQLFKNIDNIILVDHHAVGSQLSYSATILDLESSSTCEIVYNLFEAAGLSVTKEVAEHLYIGMVFDTGFFKHSITKPRTHHVAAALIATGIDFSQISDRALLERTWSAQLLLKKMMSNVQAAHDGKLIYSFWTKADMEEIGFQDGDQEGLINQLYYTDSAEMVVLFIEMEPGEVKLSFRSKGHVNVAEFARSLNPEGGGHVRAAGCALTGTLPEIIEDVLAKASNELS